MAYADLAGNEAVTGTDALDAVSNGVFVVKSGQTIPNTNEALTKSEAYTYIDIESITGNELVVKTDLVASGIVIASNVAIPNSFNPYFVFGTKYNYQVRGSYTIPGVASNVVVDFNYQDFGSSNTSVAIRSPNVSGNFYYVASSQSGVGPTGDDSHPSGSTSLFYKIGGFNIEKIRAANPSITELTCEFQAKRVSGPSWNRSFPIRGANTGTLSDNGLVNGSQIGGPVLYTTLNFDASVAARFKIQFLTSTTCNITLSYFTPTL